MIRLRYSWLILCYALAGSGAWADSGVSQNNADWREDFHTLAPCWEVRGKPGTKKAIFYITNSAHNAGSYLAMEAEQASASLLMKLDEVDLRRTPILRWRWRVHEWPANADGRDAARDDQAIGIYINAGSMLKQRSLAYRWETETPVGASGTASYAGGLVTVKWFSLRNQQSGNKAEFFIEERNIAEDFRREFGFVPAKIGLGISCNSQYTASRAAAELDWIELCAPATTRSRDPAPRSEDLAEGTAVNGLVLP